MRGKQGPDQTQVSGQEGVDNDLPKNLYKTTERPDKLQPLHVRFTPEMIREIEWRAKNHGISKAKAVRKLIGQALSQDLSIDQILTMLDRLYHYTDSEEVRELVSLLEKAIHNGEVILNDR